MVSLMAIDAELLKLVNESQSSEEYSVEEFKSYFLTNVLEELNEEDVIVAVGITGKEKLSEHVSILFNYSFFDMSIVKGVQKGIVEGNKKAIYIIDGSIMSLHRLEVITSLIRSFDYYNYILVYTGQNLPILTHNLYYFSSSNGRVNVYKTCSYCNAGKDSLVKVNFYSPASKFKHKFKLQPSFTGTFFDSTLKIGYRSLVGIISVVGKRKSGELIYGGFSYEILRIVGKTMKFNMALTVRDVAGAVVNNTPTGVLGLVHYKKADIGAKFLIPSFIRFKYVDFSAYYYQTQIVLTSDKPPRGLKLFSFLQVFDNLTWASLVVSMIVACCFYHLLQLSSVANSNNKGPTMSMSNCLWHISKITLWDTTNLKDANLSTSIMLSLYILMTYFFIASYVSTLTSFLTSAPYLRQPINSLEGFKETEYKWLGAKVEATTQLINLDSEMADRFVPMPLVGGFFGFGTHKNILQKILDQPNKFCFPYPKISVQAVIDLFFTDIDQQHQFHISKDTLGFTNIVYFLQKGAPYSHTFNIWILRLNDVGITRELVGRTAAMYAINGRKMAKAQNRKFPVNVEKVIKLKHMAGGFILYGLMMGFSAIVLLCEIVFSHRAKIRMRSKPGVARFIRWKISKGKSLPA